MNLDFESIGVWFKDNKTILLSCFLIGCLIGFVFFIFQECDKRNDRKELDRLNKGVNRFSNLAAEANANIANLMIENRLQAENVNRLATNHNLAKNSTDEARNTTNEQLDNVQRIENGNFENSNLLEATRNRCLAFPKSKGC